MTYISMQLFCSSRHLFLKIIVAIMNDMKTTHSDPFTGQTGRPVGVGTVKGAKKNLSPSV